MTTSVTFPIHTKAEPAAPGKYRTVETVGAFKSLLGVKIEAGDCNVDCLVTPDWAVKMNGFLRTIHVAFDQHHPVILSPDDIWLAVAQGFANHVNANAEALRSKFVQHQGQKYIEIQRDHFRKGSFENDWPGGFAEFSDKISEHIGDDKRRMLVSDFSTTTPLEKAASEVVLMDAMQSYFSYGCRTCCGIPNMTLLGREDDWLSIKDRVQKLADFDAAEWVTALSGVLDHFAKAFKGSADPKFWQSFYKSGGGSGGPFVSGAVNVFFPYLPSYKTKRNTNPNALAKRTDWANPHAHGPNVNYFPSGVSTVPFVWHYFAEQFKMQFLGGFVGMSEDSKTAALRPAIGWGVADRAEAS